jgi:hypothetical protein
LCSTFELVDSPVESDHVRWQQGIAT